MIAAENRPVRLIRYKNAVTRLQALGLSKVFSDNIGDAVGVSAAQVRKDLSSVNISGNRRGGYAIDALLAGLNHVLGKDQVQRVVLVGVGSLGSALLKYQGGFERHGIEIVAAFDTDVGKIRPEAPIPIFPAERMAQFISDNHVTLAAVTVPEHACHAVCSALIEAGIKGILNFAPVRIRTTDDCVVNNVNLVLEFENLIYFVKTVSESSAGGDEADESGGDASG
jgi:redox-sensing transcriptional repressor